MQKLSVVHMWTHKLQFWLRPLLPLVLRYSYLQLLFIAIAGWRDIQMADVTNILQKLIFLISGSVGSVQHLFYTKWGCCSIGGKYDKRVCMARWNRRRFLVVHRKVLIIESSMLQKKIFWKLIIKFYRYK